MSRTGIGIADLQPYLIIDRTKIWERKFVNCMNKLLANFSVMATIFTPDSSLIRRFYNKISAIRFWQWYVLQCTAITHLNCDTKLHSHIFLVSSSEELYNRCTFDKVVARNIPLQFYNNNNYYNYYYYYCCCCYYCEVYFNLVGFVKLLMLLVAICLPSV